MIMNPRNLVFLTIVFFLISLSLSAQTPLSFDFDGELGVGARQITGYENSKFNAMNHGSLEFSLKHGLDDYEVNSFLYSLGGSFTYSNIDSWWGNLDKLLISFINRNDQTMETQFRIDLGRKHYTDVTGKLLDQDLDGLSFLLDIEPVRINLGSGFLGLQSARLNNIYHTTDDINERNDSSNYFAPNRLVILGDFTLYNLIPSIELGLHSGGQFDLRESATETYESWFGGLHVYGGIAEKLIEFTGQFTYSLGSFSNPSRKEYGFLISNQWTLNFPVDVPADLYIGVDYSTGDNNEIDNFKPISNIDQGYWFRSPMVGLFILNFGTSVKPLFAADELWLRELELFFYGKNFNKTGDLPGPTVNTASTNNSSYYGIELAIGINLEPTSDITLSLLGGGFFASEADSDQMFSEFYVELSF